MHSFHFCYFLLFSLALNPDESLQQAQAAARAKHLRAKFEKWEQKEIQREQEQFRLYDGEDQSQIESTQR